MTDEHISEILLSIKEDLGFMRADLSEHMRRTAILEEEVKVIHRQANLAQGALMLLGFIISALLAIGKVVWK